VAPNVRVLMTSILRWLELERCRSITPTTNTR